MMISRRSLPATRESLTHKFSIDNHEAYLTVGLYEDGQPGEIFVKVSKEGSALSGMCQAFSRAFSSSLCGAWSVTIMSIVPSSSA